MFCSQCTPLLLFPLACFKQGLLHSDQVSRICLLPSLPPVLRMLALNAARQRAVLLLCLCKRVCSHSCKAAPHCAVCLCRHVWQACLSCKITLPSRITCETSWCRPSPSPVRTTLTCLLTRQQQQERSVFQPGLCPGLTLSSGHDCCFVYMTAALPIRMTAELPMHDCCFANACVSFPLARHVKGDLALMSAGYWQELCHHVALGVVHDHATFGVHAAHLLLFLQCCSRLEYISHDEYSLRRGGNLARQMNHTRAN